MIAIKLGGAFSQDVRGGTSGKKRAATWVCLAMVAAVCIAEEDVLPEEEPFASNMPPEWFAPPKTANELGITQFSQSPLLDGRDLPPVKERLPDDPVVSHPYERIGKYGGKARITLWDGWQFFAWEHALTISADLRNVLPNLAESWSVSEDGRVTTIRLRPRDQVVRRPSPDLQRLHVPLQPRLA